MQSTGLPCSRRGVFLRLGVKCRRTGRPYRGRGSPAPCHCASSTTPDPLSDLSNNLSTSVKESSGAASIGVVASTTEAKEQKEQVVKGASGEVEALQQPIDVEDEVPEVVAGAVSERSMERVQTEAATDDNIISVSFGDRVLMFDKSKVTTLGKNALLVFLGVTFSIAVFSTLRKFFTPQAQRKRTVNKNRELVEELMKYLPHNREALTSNVVWVLRVKTGFTTTEIFRKYLWFLLRERQFDQEAVDDLMHLKTAMDMGDDEVAAALKERAQRIYDKYGTLMLNTAGMTGAGIERKATCQALFSKLLYLVEYEPLLNPDSEGYSSADLGKIFGATENDMQKLRIVSLQEVDIDALDRLATTNGEAEALEPTKEE